jgi:ABC-type antimicrobial peptide transport system permease subunit
MLGQDITHKPESKSFGRWLKNNWNDLVYAFKDLKTQKAKTLFGVGGILISIFLIQVVGVLTDSLSFSFLNASATSVGAADFTIIKNVNAGTNYNPFMNQTLVQSQLNSIKDLQDAYPRLLLLPTADVINPLPGELPNRTISLYGINVTGEASGNLGQFTYDSNGSVFDMNIPNGSCIVTPFIVQTLHVNVGDNVTLHYATFPVVNLTVMAVVDPNEKFSEYEIDNVITNLPWVQANYSLVDQVNYFQAVVAHQELIYDTRNLPATASRMINIAEEIQAAIGPDYSVEMLKLQDLESQSTENVAMSVAFIFIEIIAIIIAAILIHSILTTSVEERIREFGIFRVLGARRTYSFKLVILQGFLFAVFGSIIGIVLGTLFAQAVLPILYNWLKLWSSPIQLIVQPTTILTTFLTGIGVTLVVTALPAYKAAQTKIIQAINPYRHQEKDYVIKREGRVNTQLIAGGLGAVAAGSLVFYLIPQLAISGNIEYILVAFVGIQIAFLFGLMFISLGFIPGLERVILQIFKIFNRKTTPVVQTSLYRYRRRNTSTVLMFSMTFAFILFIGTTLSLMEKSQSYSIYSSYGASMVLYSAETSNQVDEHLANEIAVTPGVKMVSSVYSDALDITGLSLSLTQTGLSGVSGLNFSSIFGSHTRFSCSLSDLINYNSYNAQTVGVDENYTTVMNDAGSGSLFNVNGGEATVQKLFEPNASNIIISESVADADQISVGDNVRLTFSNSTTTRLVNATVIGISSGMPGFWEFLKAKITSFLPGVMMSKENYIQWYDMNNTFGPDLPLSKIFIDVDNTTLSSMNALQNDITRTWQGTTENTGPGNEYNFVMASAQSQVTKILNSLSTVQLLFQTILLFTVMIALFGLMSSVYSTVIERKREIGVLKALGLHNDQTRNLFLMESVIILLSASIGGSLIGILSSYINTYENTTLTEVPFGAIANILNLPWASILGSFAVAVIVCLIGMAILLRPVAKQEIMDIFRQSL